MDNYIAEFKNGNFQNKKEFVNHFINSEDKSVFLKGCRTFMAVCTHEDFGLLNDFFVSCDEERLQVFEYVKRIAEIKPEPGTKYGFGTILNTL